MLLILFGLQSQTDLASGACPPTPTRNPCHLSWVTNLARQAQPSTRLSFLQDSGLWLLRKPQGFKTHHRSWSLVPAILHNGATEILEHCFDRGEGRSSSLAKPTIVFPHFIWEVFRTYSAPIPTQPHCLRSHFDFSTSPPYIASTHATPLLAHPVRSVRNFLIHSANTPRANELPSPGQTWFLSSAMASLSPCHSFFMLWHECLVLSEP